MATITWDGSNGSWGQPIDWTGHIQPGAGDSAVIDAGTVTLDVPASIGDVTLNAGGTASLLVQSTLTLGGSLILAGGTLTGGGTVDGSQVIGAFGGGLTVTQATIAATETASNSLDVTGALSLAAGSYGGGTLDLNAFSAHASETLATLGSVTLDAGETLVFSNSDPLHGMATGPAAGNVAFVIGGDTVNRGLIYSNVTAGSLLLSGASFQNAGQVRLATNDEPGMSLAQYTTSRAGIRTSTGGTLPYTRTWAPSLRITAARFDNTGTIVGNGATLIASGATFTNEGSIEFVDAATQVAITTGTTGVIGTVTLASLVTIGAGVTTFGNTGSIAAGTITFNDNLTLAELGGLTGHIVFAGTLDLQGGTLDLGSFGAGSSVSFSGVVENGTIVTQGVVADFSGTQVNVTTLAKLPVTLLDVASGAVTLDAVTSELAYTTAATIDNLSVTAGAAGTIDKIGARAAGTLTFGAGTTIADSVTGSTLAIGGLSSFADDGQIVADAATLEIATTLDGGGTISLADGASLSIKELASTATTTIVFGAGHNLLSLPADLSGSAALHIILTGLAVGDLIDFAGISANEAVGPFVQPGAGAAGGTLDVQGGSGAQASVVLGDAATGLTFVASSDQTGGTLVTVACFRTGTRIAVAGGERAVERLRIGDRVRTASGALRPVRWLGRRRYPAATVAAQRQLRPVRIMAGALGQGLPRRDLFVSPLHAMLIDGVLVPAAAIVNGTSITRAPIAAVSYVHVELDSPDIILAEGAATETFVDCDSRAMFDNAAEFAQLYPDAPDQRWAFPVPRIEEGWQLASIRHRLAAAAAPPAPGTLRGSIDRAGDGQIEGWLMDESDPGTPVEFELLAGDRQLDCLVANRYRIDLDRAGLGRGACAFTAYLPPEIASDAGLRLRRLSDGAMLGG